MATNGAERYMARGVSASKEDVHNAIANVRPAYRTRQRVMQERWNLKQERRRDALPTGARGGRTCVPASSTRCTGARVCRTLA